MAEPFDTLMEVQLRDTTLDQLRHRIEALPERAELRDLHRRQADLAEAVASVQAQVDDLAARQQALEGRIAAAAKRRHEIEQRMESGDVSASRDLQAMDHEVHQLEARQALFEEEEIALLEEEEPLDMVLAERQRASAALRGDISRLEEVIVEAEREIRAAVVTEEARRKELAATLPDELSQRYEGLRSRLGGVGAARLAGDRCDGCHLTLSSVEVERIRRLPPDQLSSCPECDRILVH
jgi:hypothetical protein